MFSIDTKTKLHVVNVNPRREKHGDENVPAVDIKLRLEASNDVLSMFDGHLKSSLYFRAAAPAAQGQLDGVAPVSELPNLRFPRLEPIRWNDDRTGYTLRIDHGLGGKSDLVLEGCSINAFGIECKEGGTVIVTLRVQADKVAEKELGKLCLMIDSDIEATLTPPEEALKQPKKLAEDWPFPMGEKTPEQALAETQGQPS